jgi:hypothetical protein
MRLVLLGGTRATELDVRVARTPEERMRGFSGRTQLTPNEAILFAFPHDTTEPFSMAHTYVPLDMLFFDQLGQMVWKIERAAPAYPGPYTVPVPYRYVLEVPGGWTESKGIGNVAVATWPVGGFTHPV